MGDRGQQRPATEPPVNPLHTHPASPFLRTGVPGPVAFASPPAKPPELSIWIAHRLEIEVALAVLGYVLVLFGASVVVHAHPSALWRYDVAALPAVPAAVALWLATRWISRLTELQKQIQLRAVTFALGASALFAFAYGFLTGAGTPQLNWSALVPIEALLWAVGTLVFTLRYR
jgi:hypothetical protein